MKIILVQQQDIVKEALIDCFQRQQYHVVDLQQKMQIFDEIDSSQPVIMICNEGCLTEGEYAFYQKVSVVNQIPMIILTAKKRNKTKKRHSALLNTGLMTFFILAKVTRKSQNHFKCSFSVSIIVFSRSGNR